MGALLRRVAALVLMLATAVPAAVGSDAEALGQRIVAFCREHKGEKVGTGRCSDLVTEALKAVDAKPAGAYHDHGRWACGRQVYYLEVSDGTATQSGSLRDIMPGDVILMHDAKFRGLKQNGKPYSKRVGRHVEVVGRSNGMGCLLTFEQNVGDRKTVGPGRVQLSDLKGGWIRIYRPEPKPG